MLKNFPKLKDALEAGFSLSECAVVYSVADGIGAGKSVSELVAAGFYREHAAYQGGYGRSSNGQFKYTPPRHDRAKHVRQPKLR